MNMPYLERVLVTKQLYRLFHVDYRYEEYMITVKLLFIYDYLASTGCTNVMDKVTELRRTHLFRGRKKTIDSIYKELEHLTLKRNGRYAHAGARIPQPMDRDSRDLDY